MRFICDQMLGSLAKWLRILGYDTLYANTDVSDEEILDTAVREERILISRDKLLVQKGRRKGLSVIGLTSVHLQEQIKQVLELVGYNDESILSRCLICNIILEPVDKETIIDKVPLRILGEHELFYHCRGCGRVYWMGTHYRNMIEKLKDIRNSMIKK